MTAKVARLLTCKYIGTYLEMVQIRRTPATGLVPEAQGSSKCIVTAALK